ncbi:hypothetical protein H5410_026782 [Solanum commersonii]|uniref:F-box family protein n=1 Tax=Solanum commersonii TaxID=4109 RepID=A0A9J5YY12_SOLCO|nr:hypothetical protein H5410_026782 [Solanum commersonii]
MVNMNNRGTEVIIDENEIDKISDLPIDILDEIFKDLQELVKTCILLKKWEHFWAMHPILVLDGEFFKEISGNIGLTEDGFSVLVDNILFKHVGSIVRFFLDLSTIYYTDDRDLGHLLLCVTSKCVKELTLKNCKHNRYTLPFCIFDCPTLTYLDVTNFISIKLHPAKENYVLNTPLLSSLALIAYNGVHLLTIFAPRIQFLTINDSHDIRTIFFVNFSNVRELLFREESYCEEGRFITWSRLLYLCPNLIRLVLINYCIQVFNTLSERNIGEVTHYLEDPNCVDKQFEKLEFVELRKFEGTQFELYFLKKKLAYSPSLSRIIVEPSDDIDVAEVLRLYEELMMSLKASPRVKVIVAPHGQAA